ncbi:MAG: hypothetical protein ACKPKO_56730, partial [Candidatus Fonsibacter sp.]
MEKQKKWVQSVENNKIILLECGSSPWTYHERRLVQQADGSFKPFLTPIISRIHWLYQPLFDWNCDWAQPKPSESQVLAEQVVWYCDPRTKQLRWRVMSEAMQAGMRRLQRERRRGLAEAFHVLSPNAPETKIAAYPED